MKRILALLLILVMCASVFVGCSKKNEQTGATLEQAKDYLYNIMKDKNDKATPNDYDVIGKLIIDETPFEVTWTTDNENIVVKESSKANWWTIDIPAVNVAEVKYTLTATIKNAEGNTIQVSFTPILPVFSNLGIVTEPVAGVAYKLFFRQIDLGRTYYASNTTEDNANKFIEAKLDPKEAADFYVEPMNGGYKIYTMINGVKNYVHATATPKSGGTGYTKTIGFNTETDSVFFYNSTLQTFYVEIGGEKFGVGTYGSYETISISELTKYFTEDNIEVKKGQFPMRFMESAYAVTLTPDVIPPHVHEYVDGFCSCGEADPNATTTNQAPIITAETLELDAYADGSKTLGGIEFNFTELGTYGEGIQWRTKNGKIASLWNATATPLGIAKIEITLAEGRDGYSNTDALVIAFGNAADSLTYSTTLSTISGTAKYTITPDAGTYTFFKMTHNFDKTMYIARIAIYYTGGAVHEHNFVDGNCACGESDPNYVPSAPSHTCADTNGDYLCDEETCTNVIAPAADSTLTIVQANALGMAHAHNKYTSGQYTVVGEILSVDNVSYGNITIKDADGNILVIYGSKAADGTDYSALAVKYIVGDIVSVYGIIGKYSDAAQMKNGLVTVVEQHDHVYDAGECACGAADPDFVPTHTCADEDGDYVCDEADCDKYLLPAEGTVLTVEQALKIGELYKNESGALYAPYKYYIVGTITDDPNTYGACTIEDATGTIYVYGLKDSTGDTSYSNLLVKPVKGDTIKIYGQLGAYRNGVQFNSSNIIEHIPVEPTDPPAGEEGGDIINPPAGEVTASKTMAELITANGWDSTTTKQTFKLDDVVSVAINGGANTGKAYNGDHIRIYATDTPAGTITISLEAGYELVSIKCTAVTGTYAFLCIDGTQDDIANTTVSVSGSSVLLTSVKNGTEGKQIRLTGMEVVYRAVSA